MPTNATYRWRGAVERASDAHVANRTYAWRGAVEPQVVRRFLSVTTIDARARMASSHIDASERLAGSIKVNT